MSQEHMSFVVKQQSELDQTSQQTPSRTEQAKLADLEGIRKVAQQHMRLIAHWRQNSAVRIAVEVINTITILLMAADSTEALNSVRAFFVELQCELSPRGSVCDDSPF